LGVGLALIPDCPKPKRAHNARMDFLLTDHARQEAWRRQIPMEWIEATLAHPEQVACGANGRKVFQSRVVAEGKA